MDAYFSLARDLLTNPSHSKWISSCLIAAEAMLGVLIIWKISYTEIDWTTYMQQVRFFVEGERDYSLIKGDTGPIVYPAVHLYIYTTLYYLTDEGTDILLAQCLFHVLYLVTLAFVLACYRRNAAPPWLLIPLVLSKRLHSVFLLRLFNDTWAALGLWVSIHSFQRRKWLCGALAWCLGLGVKMTLLLAAPAVAAILLQGAGFSNGVLIGILLPQLQFAIATPFLLDGKGRQYLSAAFDLGRRFLFRWTVNWRFLGEEVFLSDRFAFSLLAAHFCVLLLFLHSRWVKPSSSGLFDFVQKYTRSMDKISEQRISKRVTSLFVMDSMLGSMALGMLFARSLHYQFYAYIAWAIPYLLWRSGLGPIWVLGNSAMQELAWLKYPSTDLSSSVVVLELSLAVASLWWGSRRRGMSSEGRSAELAKEHIR